MYSQLTVIQLLANTVRCGELLIFSQQFTKFRIKNTTIPLMCLSFYQISTYRTKFTMDTILIILCSVFQGIYRLIHSFNTQIMGILEFLLNFHFFTS